MTDRNPAIGTTAAVPAPLALWRRLDWRFLLPTLEPRRVAFGGAIDEELLAALQLLDPSASEIGELSLHEPMEAPPEVVILIGPTFRDLHLAITSLSGGGWIYAEVRRTLSLRTDGPRTLAGWHQAFVRLGLHDIQLSWHAPNLVESSRIVPLDSWSATRDTLNRHDNVRFGALISTLGKIAYRLKVFTFAVPEGSLVARVADVQSSDAS